MSSDEPLYNLKAVVQMTGIPAASLRAWEKRYGVITPLRKPNGHRVYPASEVERLLRLKAAMAQGMTISQAAEQLCYQAQPQVYTTEVDRIRDRLAAALSGLDVPQANTLFGEALALLTTEQVCLRVVRPLLGSLTPFGRTYMRSRLGALLLHVPVQNGAPTALVISTDLQDLQPLLVAVFLSRRGYRVIYVEGTEVPAGIKPDLLIDPRQWGNGIPPEELFG